MKTTNLISMFAAAVGLFLAAVAPAFATPIDLKICYTLTTSGLSGNAPSIANDFGSGDCQSITWATLGTKGPDNLFTASPAGSSPGNKASENLSVTFTVSDLDSGLPPTTNIDAIATGTYTANYTFPTLACAASDPSSQNGQSDCILWSTTNNPMQFTLTGVDAGTFLDITLNNAVDWNITPTVTFNLTKTPLGKTPPLPEPGTLALLGVGLAGFAASRRRKLD
jgi:hypothetical protein